MELRFFSWREWRLLFFSVTILLSVFFVMRQRFLWALAASFGFAFSQAVPGDAETVFGLESGGRRLRFKPDGSFKISVFEDLHFGEGEDNREFSYCLDFAPISRRLLIVFMQRLNWAGDLRLISNPSRSSRIFWMQRLLIS
jgi:hypothetical protein